MLVSSILEAFFFVINAVTSKVFVQKTSTAIFLDTTSMKGNSKQVRPLQEQGENESRSLWRNVISALKVKDLDTATNEKKKLEEKQRNDAKMRLETKQTWETQVGVQISFVKSVEAPEHETFFNC